MGRINRFFIAQTVRGSARGRAKIDSGADRTLLRYDIACRLGLDINAAKMAAMGTAGQGRMLGFEFPIDVQVGERRARVSAFVPIYSVVGDEHRRVRGNNLIGSDFLQKARVMLDYSRPHAAVLSRAEPWPPDYRTVRIRSSEARFLRALAPACPGRRRNRAR